MAVFNCAEKTLLIYHLRFRTIEALAAPYLKNRTILDLFQNHSLICMAIDESNYANLTKKNLVDAIIRLISSKTSAVDCDMHIILEAHECYARLMTKYDEVYSQKKSTITADLLPKFLSEVQKLDPHSYESIILRLYYEVPVRDDFQLIMIHPESLFKTTNEDENYAIPDLKERVVRILIQKSKNVGWNKSQKPRLYTLSPELSKDFLYYWKKIGFKREIFTGKQYKKVGEALRMIGLKDTRDSINFIRKLVAHEAKEINDRAESAYRSLHTITTAAVYEN